MQIFIFYKVTTILHMAYYLAGHQSFLKYKLPALSTGAPAPAVRLVGFCWRDDPETQCAN